MATDEETPFLYLDSPIERAGAHQAILGSILTWKVSPMLEPPGVDLEAPGNNFLKIFSVQAENQFHGIALLAQTWLETRMLTSSV